AYLLERLVDAAAREFGMSPDAIRRINFVPQSAMPYTSATKLLLDSGELEEVMDRCMAAAEWSSFPERRARSERNDKLPGIGMATYTERCGGGFPETASIEFKDERIEFVMGNQEYGTGLVTSYKHLRPARRRSGSRRRDNGRHRPHTIRAYRRFACACRRGRGALRGGAVLHLQNRAARLPPACNVRGRGPVFLWGVLPAPPPVPPPAFRRRAIPRNCRQAWSRGSTRRITACRKLRPFPTAATSPRSRSIPIPATS